MFNVMTAALTLPRITNALKLDSGEYLSVTDGSYAGLNTFSCEMWVRIPHNDTSWRGLYGAGDSHWQLYLDDNGETRFIIWGDKGSNIGAVSGWSETEWFHLAYSFNNTELKVYVDGVQVGATAAITNTTVSTGVVWLGHGAGGSTLAEANATPCYIAEVRHWNFARSEAQVLGDYNKPLSGSETGLVAYWPLQSDFSQRVAGGPAAWSIAAGTPTIEAGAGPNPYPLPGPSQILGASLTDWFDASEGVTLVSTRVSGWSNQATGGDATQTTDGNRPTYIASGADGTPELDFPRLADGFSYTDSVPDELTCWILINSPSTVAGCLLVAEAHASVLSLWPQGWPTTARPYIYDGSWHDPGTVSNVGWHVIRFSVRDTGTGTSSMAVDDNAQDSASYNWVPSGANWTYLSRIEQDHSLYGEVKQIVIANQFLDDADAEHGEMLAYFKDRYPTLVTY
jgi:hypothetical protein